MEMVGWTVETNNMVSGNNVKAKLDASLFTVRARTTLVLDELISGGGAVCGAQMGAQDIFCKAQRDALT